MNKFFFITLLIAVCCRATAQDSQKSSKDTLIVSFISIGAGTDYKAEDRLELFVKDFEAENKIKLPVSIKTWGREGERDYRYDLKQLSKKQCKAFVDGVTEMFRENNLVKIRQGDSE